MVGLGDGRKLGIEFVSVLETNISLHLQGLYLLLQSRERAVDLSDVFQSDLNLK